MMGVCKHVACSMGVVRLLFASYQASLNATKSVRVLLHHVGLLPHLGTTFRLTIELLSMNKAK